MVEDETDKSKRWIRGYSIRSDFVRSQQENEWIKEHKDKLSVKPDNRKYRETYTRIGFVDKVSGIYYSGMVHAGQLTQEFTSIDGKKGWTITVYDTSPFRVTTHELYRLVVHANYEIVQTSIGPVFAYTGSNPDPQKRVGGAAAWISGDHYAVYVAGSGMPLNEVLAEVGKKYPSTLKEPSVDRTTWGRVEVQMRLDRISAIVDDRELENEVILHIGAIASYVDCPMLLNGDVLVKPGLVARKQLCRDVDTWWNEHKKRTKWSDSRHRLIIVDVDGKEIESAKRDDRVAVEGGQLDIKMTNAEISAARVLLIDMFERNFVERTKQRTKELGKFGNQVQWSHDGKEQWSYEEPTANGGPVRRMEYGSPVITREGMDRGVPLMAVFPVKLVVPGKRDPVKFDEVYFYHRLEKQWTRGR